MVNLSTVAQSSATGIGRLLLANSLLTEQAATVRILRILADCNAN